MNQEIERRMLQRIDELKEQNRELLQALKDVEHALEYNHASGTPQYNALMIAKEAIAKAEGRK